MEMKIIEWNSFSSNWNVGILEWKEHIQLMRTEE